MPELIHLTLVVLALCLSTLPKKFASMVRQQKPVSGLPGTGFPWRFTRSMRRAWDSNPR